MTDDARHCYLPSMCSTCLGAPVRRVTLIDGQAAVDGVAVRKGEAPGLSQRDYGRAVRGAKRKGRRR